MNKPLKTFFDVVLNGLDTRLEWNDSLEFVRANATKHIFGQLAIDKNLESPIKARFVFKHDGTIQSLRGDKFTGYPVEMVKNLHKLALSYIQKNNLHEVTMYDNRNLLPEGQRIILKWHQVAGTTVNLLPLYSGEFDLKRKHHAKSKN